VPEVLAVSVGHNAPTHSPLALISAEIRENILSNQLSRVDDRHSPLLFEVLWSEPISQLPRTGNPPEDVVQ